MAVGFRSLLNRLLALQYWMVLHMNAHSINLFIFMQYILCYGLRDGDSLPALWLGCRVTQQNGRLQSTQGLSILLKGSPEQHGRTRGIEPRGPVVLG